jgi:uncharacterized delta-60 repeat protein
MCYKVCFQSRLMQMIMNLLTGAGLRGLIALGTLCIGISCHGGDALLEVGESSFVEGDFAQLRVQRSGNLELAFSIDYIVTNATAKAGINFVFTKGTLDFAPGERQKYVHVQTIDDGILSEEPLMFEVRFANVPPGVSASSKKIEVPEKQFPTGFDWNFRPVVNSFRWANAAATLTPEGDIIVAYRTSSSWLSASMRLAMLAPDGALKRELGALPETVQDITDLFWLPGGKFLVLGNLVASTNGLRQLFRLNPDGSLDAAFQSPFKVNEAVGPFLAFPLAGEGFLVQTVSATCQECTNTIVRLRTDGSIDTAFSSLTVNGYISQVKAAPEGKLVVVGPFSGIGGVARPGLARLTAAGVVDAAFGPELARAAGESATVAAAAIQADGKILIAGSFARVNGIQRTNYARLNPDGSTDVSFSHEGSEHSYFIETNADGTIIVGALPRFQQLDVTGKVLQSAPAAYLYSLGRILRPSGNKLLFLVPDPIGGGWLMQIQLQKTPRTVVAFASRDQNWFLERFDPPRELPEEQGTNRNEMAIAVVRLGDTTFSAAVRVKSRSITAASGVDYLPVDVVLTFAPFEQEKEVFLSVLPDNLREDGEVLELELEPLHGFEAAARPLQITIRDSAPFIFREGVRRPANGRAAFSFYDPSHAGQVEASSDLRTWSPVTGSVSSVPGPVFRQNCSYFEEQKESNARHRFFRIKAP